MDTCTAMLLRNKNSEYDQEIPQTQTPRYVSHICGTPGEARGFMRVFANAQTHQSSHTQSMDVDEDPARIPRHRFYTYSLSTKCHKLVQIQFLKKVTQLSLPSKHKSGPLSTSQRNAIGWRFAGGPIVVQYVMLVGGGG